MTAAAQSAAYKIGYARVSTEDQNLDGQLASLHKAECTEVYSEHASGKLASRPELDKALARLRPGDKLVITKLDRLGRSLKNLIELSEMLAEKGVDLIVLDQGIDTSTPAGKMFFHMVAAFAQFERDMISERTKDGLRVTRLRGRKGGRKPKLTGPKLTHAYELYDSKQCTVEEIADLLGVTRSTVYRALDKRREQVSA